MTIWTPERLAFLREHYPTKGKMWCVEQMGLAEHQVRYKASHLGLKARGISEAWQEKTRAHSERIAGRKRPDQAAVINRLREEGRLVTSEEGKRRAAAATRKRLAEHHPRGALGMKHTPEAKAKMSARGVARWERMTDQEVREWAQKGAITRAERGIVAPGRIGIRWKAGWREVGGRRLFFRSRWEANYARHLQQLLDCGAIRDWQHEPRRFVFSRAPAGTVSYLPDFLVVDSEGGEAYHEVKGWFDGRSQAALDAMADEYPQIRLVLIRRDEYAAIQRASLGVVEGWEPSVVRISRCVKEHPQAALDLPPVRKEVAFP